MARCPVVLVQESKMERREEREGERRMERKTKKKIGVEFGKNSLLHSLAISFFPPKMFGVSFNTKTPFSNRDASSTIQGYVCQ